ncbi:MAG: inorganic diphosphatase [Bacteroidota bacterium]
MMRKIALYLLLGTLWLASCQMPVEEPLYTQPTFDAKGDVQAVIEIPAGTNQKIEFNPATKQFEVDVIDGKKRVIDFLPYPANYGFIPSTLMTEAAGGDGDALDVLVIGESQATGTLLAVRPIAALELLDEGEIDTKIIAVPADSTLQIIEATDFATLLIRYNAVQYIIESWFLNYKGLGVMELVAWKNETEALRLIRRWTQKENLKN